MKTQYQIHHLSEKIDVAGIVPVSSVFVSRKINRHLVREKESLCKFHASTTAQEGWRPFFSKVLNLKRLYLLRQGSNITVMIANSK